MTVIAYRDGEMAGDGRLSGSTRSGELLGRNDVKVFKINNNLVGVAGSADEAEYMLDCLRKDSHPGGKLKNIQCLRYSKDEGIMVYEGHWWRCREKYYAIGVGGVLAMMAMDMGATATEAVRATCKRNVFCGGKITKVTL